VIPTVEGAVARLAEAAERREFERDVIDTGQGKSQISVDFTARITKLGEWPDGDEAPFF
jgi:hypothetical protein